MKYRKKPIVIEAIQFKDDSAETIMAIQDFKQGDIKVSYDNPDHPQLEIFTLEGTMRAGIGDWIIKEPFPTDDRKFYPCKPDIFEATYESVEEIPRLTHKEEFLRGFDGGECWGV